MLTANCWIPLRWRDIWYRSGVCTRCRGEVIATVLVLQTLRDLSDAEAMDALRCDIRRKVACGLPIDHEGVPSDGVA